MSFGGPAGQIALMHAELVDKRRWISEERFLHALNYCMLLPGPEAQQLATFVGYRMHGLWGGLVSGGLFVLPGFLLMLALAVLYWCYGATPLMGSVFAAVKPAVVAIVIMAAVRMAKRNLKARVLVAVAAASCFFALVLGVPFPLVVLAAAVLGGLLDSRWPGRFIPRRTQAAQAAKTLPKARLLKVCATGLALWAVSYALVMLLFGVDAVLTQMAAFFTRAALVTFGGAYAVLPYVFDAAVHHYHWLNPAQMVDALALGESTPGPLVLVLTFAGFLGGAQHAVLGADAPILGGLLAASVVTFFTFLPSFLFIFLGAPLVDRTQGNARLAAPLAAIGAAVVGVIVALALTLAGHVFAGQGGGVNVPAITIALACLFAQWRLGWSVIRVIAVCAAAGAIAALGGMV